jgi:hypothetical protein
MESCADKGVALLVRVLPADPSRDIGLGIISPFHYPPDIPIVTCATMEEAMNYLRSCSKPQFGNCLFSMARVMKTGKSAQLVYL